MDTNTKPKSDTERAILDALADGEWIARYGGLYDRVSASWRRMYPDRRNRPRSKPIDTALKRLIASGVVETKTVGLNEFTTDTYYRLAKGAS